MASTTNAATTASKLVDGWNQLLIFRVSGLPPTPIEAQLYPPGRGRAKTIRVFPVDQGRRVWFALPRWVFGLTARGGSVFIGIVLALSLPEI